MKSGLPGKSDPFGWRWIFSEVSRGHFGLLVASASLFSEVNSHNRASAMLLKSADPLQVPVGDYMCAEQLEFFRSLLVAKRSDFTDRVIEIERVLASTDRYPDEIDQAAFDSQRTIDLRILARLRIDISEARLAIDRIDDGEYGYCVETGEEIGIERLLRSPSATHTFDAMQRLENMAKHLIRRAC